MKIVAIIPSRYGSTRFEGKPLALIAGKPMIQHVYERAARAEKIHQVAVATDDRRILEAVEAFGGQALMTSADNRSGTDRVAEAAMQLGLALDDIVINVQGDQPLINPSSFNSLVAPLVRKPEIGMSTLAYRITDLQEYTNPKDCKVVMDNQGFALYFSRAPIPFFRDDERIGTIYKHLGVYAYTRQFLEIFRKLPMGELELAERLEQLRALEHGHGIKVIVTPYDSLEVDLPEDIGRIEKMIRSQ